MRKRRTKKKRDKRTLTERQTAEERRTLLEAAKIRRGKRLDFTTRKLNSRTDETGKLRKIIRCYCGQKGVLSGALAPSLLIIHRGTLKEGKFNMSEFHVASGKELR